MTVPDKSKSGWKLFAHPAFSETFDALVAEVERLRTADRKGYRQHPKTKLLKRIVDLVEIEIPRNPGAPNIRWATRWGRNIGIGGGLSFSGVSACSFVIVRKIGSLSTPGSTIKTRYKSRRAQ